MFSLFVAFATLLGAHRPEGGPFFSCRDAVGFPPGTVATYGGRMVVGETLWMLDASADHPALLSITGPGTSPARRPVRLEEPLDVPNTGLARAADGRLCALSASDKSLQCFDATAKDASVRTLPSRAQVLLSMFGTLAWVAYEPHADRPLVFLEKGDGTFAAAEFVRSRGGPTLEDALVANLFICGLASSDRIPCWFLDGSDLRRVSRAGKATPIRLPEAARAASSYPIRDAAAAEGGILWLVLNDPPTRPGRRAGPPLRLMRLEEATGKFETHALPRPAQGILRADAKSALLLFRDGGAATCAEGGP
ncbi:MAG: hypothetical protein ABI592_01840 [Acidobacteriota bacterium]